MTQVANDCVRWAGSIDIKMSAAIRAPYAAQTPDARTFGADASIPLARFDDGEEDDPDALIRSEENDDGGLHTNRNAFGSKCKAVYKKNIGLLLVAISVAFASMMSTLVKLMNSIDPPVPMLEVSFDHLQP